MLQLPGFDFELYYRVGNALLDCVCQALAMTPGGCPPRIGAVPGTEVVADNCCDGQGQLTVNIVNVYPSLNFPVPYAGENANCNIPYDVVSYNVLVLRCAPVGTPDYPPDTGKLDDAARLTMMDIVAMRAGASCCLNDRTAMTTMIGNETYRWVFGDHLTVGPEGGCAGSSMSVVVGLPTCQVCL
jgi:hypothetical protein